MANLIDIYAEVGANMIGDDSNPTFEIKNTSTGFPLQLNTTGVQANLNVLVSNASGVVFRAGPIEGGYVSTNSTATVSYALRIAVNGGANDMYYIPVYLGAA